MPRGARLDAPGTLHHVMVRGIEGNSIVADDEDRLFFVSRMGTVAAATGTSIYAWALMTNHAHILLKSGAAGLSTFMRRLLSGYATGYNLSHKRHGHLFQNRYKSIVCEEEPYFLRLVSYIHLNPLRAGLTETLDDLERYPWSGHAYQEFVAEESVRGRQPELTGGGLIRSTGGWSEVTSLRKRQEKQFSDERILGSGEFVKEILDDVEESVKERLPATAVAIEAGEGLLTACEEAGISVQALQGGSRKRKCTELRKRLALNYVFELGMSYAGAARLLGISAAAVNQIVKRFES